MAFADELFHNNQFLPLKLPPRLQCPSPPPPSPPKPRGTSIWKMTLSALGFKRKEFDPFMAAMKRIRKEGTTQHRKPGHSRIHEGSKKKVRKDDNILFLGALRGKGGVKYKVNDHRGGVRGLRDGLEQHGDDYNARMFDVKEMRNRSLTRYKRSRATFLSCFGFGPR
ncbi:hypothetical protein COCNU_04G006260 [Cocos nucifera]|uniref:Uncharacterized protein n=1 Tax=Cocos nucifera TaxID=13894 RepID=A0A8K0I5H6_COCNU|nr:hypothetical protein COCNU_04G006260 [Cocos nucifera]